MLTLKTYWIFEVFRFKTLKNLGVYCPVLQPFIQPSSQLVWLRLLWLCSSRRAAEGACGSPQLDSSEGAMETAVRSQRERHRTWLPCLLRPARTPRRTTGQRAAYQTGPAWRIEVRGHHWRTPAGHCVSVWGRGIHAQGTRRPQSTEESPHERLRSAHFSFNAIIAVFFIACTPVILALFSRP